MEMGDSGKARSVNTTGVGSMAPDTRRLLAVRCVSENLFTTRQVKPPNLGDKAAAFDALLESGATVVEMAVALGLTCDEVVAALVRIAKTG